ncbi:hypothetical protein IL992_31615 [Microbispora sp. NEAU-D428]|uniref:hypothetical protein n=1 Tax=Microbispora sitophila TaxID=2771537 RepID=UPI001868AABA|nr:hypothetical protein [Microbispora sitophila]MBE3013695.1 hypothetical protein [Microbispora sitophila]
MAGIARAAMYAVLPAELLLTVLVVSGMPLPGPLLAMAELTVTAVFVLVTVTAYRLFRIERRNGADRWAALRATVDLLVPLRVRTIMEFELKGMVSLVLWIARRRVGVPPGATALTYSREQAPVLLVLLFLMTVETIGVDLLLIGMDVPDAVRLPVLAADVYGIVYCLMLGAACATRPHVVTGKELRIRYGVYFDLRVPRDLIASVRLSRSYDERAMVRVADGRLSVAVSHQTNVTVELVEPVTVVRPLGSRAEASVIRLFADDPRAALDALRDPAEAQGIAERA